jgi:hypothetical protein
MLNMITMEQVEKLRTYADVSYEEAKNALERAGGDLLEALILLEKEGKTKGPKSGGRIVTQEPEREQTSQKTGNGKEKEKRQGSSFSELVGRFFRWLGNLIQKGNVNVMAVERRGEKIIDLPLTILVLLLIFAFWVVIPLMIVGLFFNFRYSFHGPDVGTVNVNKVMDDVASAAEGIKKDFTKETKTADTGKAAEKQEEGYGPEDTDR